MAPDIYTYHCICTSLLLASTHKLSSLPRRSLDAGSIDTAIILPLSEVPTSKGELDHKLLPPQGYTLLLGIEKDVRLCTVRRSDGFERRILCYCSRCRVLVGYELSNEPGLSEIGNEDDKITRLSDPRPIKEKLMYLLPGGIMSTEFMTSKKSISEEDIQISNKACCVFESI